MINVYTIKLWASAHLFMCSEVITNNQFLFKNNYAMLSYAIVILLLLYTELLYMSTLFISLHFQHFCFYLINNSVLQEFCFLVGPVLLKWQITFIIMIIWYGQSLLWLCPWLKLSGNPVSLLLSIWSLWLWPGESYLINQKYLYLCLSFLFIYVFI